MLKTIFFGSFNLKQLFKDTEGRNGGAIIFGRGSSDSSTIVLRHTPKLVKEFGTGCDDLILLLSRKHARIFLQGRNLHVADNGTVNGTFVNDRKLPVGGASEHLKDNDTITFGGGSKIKFRDAVVDNPWSFTVERLHELIPEDEAIDVTGEEEGGGERETNNNAIEIKEEKKKKRKAEMAFAAEIIDLTGDGDGGGGDGAGTAVDYNTKKRVVTNGSSNELVLKVKEEFSCVVCQDLVVGAVAVVPCGHIFCGMCLLDWLKDHKKCPTCRATCTAPPIRQHTTDTVVASAVKDLSEGDKKVYKERMEVWGKKKTEVEGRLRGIMGQPSAAGEGNRCHHFSTTTTAMMTTMTRGPRQAIVRESLASEVTAMRAGSRHVCDGCRGRIERGELMMSSTILDGYHTFHVACCPFELLIHGRCYGVLGMNELREVDAARIRTQLAKVTMGGMMGGPATGRRGRR